MGYRFQESSLDALRCGGWRYDCVDTVTRELLGSTATVCANGVWQVWDGARLVAFGAEAHPSIAALEATGAAWAAKSGGTVGQYERDLASAD